MKKSEYIIAKVCGILCVIGGVVAFILFAVKGVVYISSVLFVVFMFFLGIGLLLVTPKPRATIPEERTELKRIVEERKGKENVDYDKVLIAHYNTGNVKDPLGVVHDEIGKPILSQNEKIVYNQRNMKCNVSTTRNPRTWSFFLGNRVFHDAGPGTLYITNRRVIYIREPQPAKQLTASGPLGAAQQTGVALQAKEWLEKGRSECVSIPMSTIVKCIKSKTTRIYSSDGLANYSAFIKPCRSELWSKLIMGTTTQSAADLIDVKCSFANQPSGLRQPKSLSELSVLLVVKKAC